jgi:hypothetical protein
MTYLVNRYNWSGDRMKVNAPKYNKSLVGANRSLQSSWNEAVDDMQVFFH